MSQTISPNDPCFINYTNDMGGYNPVNNIMSTYGTCLQNYYQSGQGSTGACLTNLQNSLNGLVSGNTINDSTLANAVNKFMTCVQGEIPTTAPPTLTPTLTPTYIPPFTMYPTPPSNTNEFPTDVVIAIVIGVLILSLIAVVFWNWQKIKTYVKGPSEVAKLSSSEIKMTKIGKKGTPSKSKISGSKKKVGKKRR